jgi:WhiB family redox-sensing transcriptional regulator
VTLMVDDPESWRKDAACLETPNVNFFPGSGESTLPAKKVCETCLVRAACLEYALKHRIEHGVWGGCSERERRRMMRSRRLAATV